MSNILVFCRACARLYAVPDVPCYEHPHDAVAASSGEVPDVLRVAYLATVDAVGRAFENADHGNLIGFADVIESLFWRITAIETVLSPTLAKFLQQEVTRIRGTSAEQAAERGSRSAVGPLIPNKRVSRGQPNAAQSVGLGASAPSSASPGDEIIARFVAYPSAEEVEARALLSGLDPDARPHLGGYSAEWRPGTAVTVRVTCGTHRVAPEVQTFVWQGLRVLREFSILVDSASPPRGKSVLKLSVVVGDILVATLNLSLAIAPTVAAVSMDTVQVRAGRTAFASYASADRDRVLDRVASLKSVAKIDVFVDHLSLRPGEQWRARLREEILGRDLFLLFWSASARSSEWVEWEWQTALAERGIDFILPQPLGSVAEAPAPQELSALHFADYHMLLRSPNQS